MADTIVLSINVFDCDGCVADTFPVEFTLDQLSDIVSHAAQLVVEHRARQVPSSVDELHETFVAVGVFN